VTEILLKLMQSRVCKLRALNLGDAAAIAAADQLMRQFEDLYAREQRMGLVTKRRPTVSVGNLVQLRTMGSGQLSGIASTPDKDHMGHKVQPGAFTESIRKRGLKGARGIKLLLDHEWSKPAGAITRLEYNARGQLEIDCQMALEVSYARDRYEAIKAAGGYNFSVGFRVEDYEIVETNDDIYALIKSGDLFEVSLVAFPANDGATLNLAASTPDAMLADMLSRLRHMNTQLQGA